MSNFLLPIVTLGSIIVGVLVGYVFRKLIVAGRVDSAETRAGRIVEEAKTKAKDALLEAKDKSLQILEEAKQEEAKRREELTAKEQRLEKRESRFDKKISELEDKEKKVEETHKRQEELREELRKIRDQQLEKLQKVAQMSLEDAKKILLQYVEKSSQEDLMERVRKLDSETQDVLEGKAKEMLSSVIQRCAASHSVEITTTAVAIPSDEMKGRIIGKEGRNIKALEQLTGVEIIVDETPNMITVSGFSSLRRQLTKRALDKLVLDGRIHPARIEDVVAEAKQELALEIKKAGEEALYEMGITGVDPKLVMLLGRLKYRTSYGQSNLQHAVEVAHLARMLAEELGEDPTVAKKAGLFHDIGKAVDHEVQGGHPEIGYTILKKFNMPEEVAYPSIGHHEDKPKTLIAIIVQAADAISGARPGARKDSLEQYIKRLEDIEKIATSFEGVTKSYAIQAGREVRVFVTPEIMDDFAAHKLASEVARKIEAELQYPGEIKITVIRESRFIEYAR